MDGAERQPEPLGDLTARETTPEDQLDHVALGRRQQVQPLLDLDAQQRCVVAGVRRGQWVDRVVGELAPQLLAAPAA